jgi:hypothetical protein
MQDSNFREVRRVTNLLLELGRYERMMEAIGRGWGFEGSGNLMLSRRVCLAQWRRPDKIGIDSAASTSDLTTAAFHYILENKWLIDE